VPNATVSLPVPQPFDLRLALFGHGWLDLPPHQFDEATTTWTTALRVGERVVRAEVKQRGRRSLAVKIHADRKPSQRTLDSAMRQIAHMLRLECDLGEFHSVCDDEPRLRWAARRGAGRLLRSPTVFEDLMKLLFTTNTTWSGTKAMTNKLVAACGTEGPGGIRAFPTAQQCLRDPAFYRDTVRAGYRAEAAHELAAGFVDGTFTDELFLAPQPGCELKKRLLSLRGFGPYAAGQAMRLLGHYSELALDSWCRARLAQLDGRKKPPTDRAVIRRYAKYRPFQGLALWLDLTAEWHGEGQVGTGQ